MFEITGLDYYAEDLHEYKKALIKTLEYVQKESLNPDTSLLAIGLGLGTNHYEVETYLKQQISAIESKLQSMSVAIPELNTLPNIGLDPYPNNDSRINRLEKKVDDAVTEFHERMEKDMPIVHYVHDKLTEAEIEKTTKNKENADNTD